MPKKYNNRYEYVTEKQVDWLADFADAEALKLAKQNNISVDELKTAGHIENILDIVNRQKKETVESKVAKYRELVGLDMVDKIEKEGGKEVTASRISLSIRDKVAQAPEVKEVLHNMKQYIEQVIKNRNGVIATPAILDQLESYMKVDKEWLRNNYEAIKKIIEQAREHFNPQTYNEVSVNELAKNDGAQKGDKEPPLFMPPANTGE